MQAYLNTFDQAVGMECIPPCPADLLTSVRSGLEGDLTRVPTSKYRDFASKVLLDRSLTKIKREVNEVRKRDLTTLMEKLMSRTNETVMNQMFAENPQLTEVSKQKIIQEINTQFPDGKLCCPKLVAEAIQRELGQTAQPITPPSSTQGRLRWKH